MPRWSMAGPLPSKETRRMESSGNDVVKQATEGAVEAFLDRVLPLHFLNNRRAVRLTLRHPWMSVTSPTSKAFVFEIDIKNFRTDDFTITKFVFATLSPPYKEPAFWTDVASGPPSGMDITLDLVGQSVGLPPLRKKDTLPINVAGKGFVTKLVYSGQIPHSHVGPSGITVFSSLWPMGVVLALPITADGYPVTYSLVGSPKPKVRQTKW